MALSSVPFITVDEQLYCIQPIQYTISKSLLSALDSVPDEYAPITVVSVHGATFGDADVARLWDSIQARDDVWSPSFLSSASSPFFG